MEEKIVSEAFDAEQKEYVVNCLKCGAALKVKNDGCAYVCPVCRSMFLVKVTQVQVKDE